ncbi:MAG: rRNA maturation RNase YbeY [Candidatus Shikimatogenerans sp. JK-2022]|nr:rRNA maturation RNase YbeY [Candidatus Shikimatogenerans bostrichidophilus]
MINIYILKNIIIYKYKLFKKKINEIVNLEKKKIHILNYIFCNNKYILYINYNFFKKNTYTDTISFNYNENKNYNKIFGDIFISVEEVYLNSLRWKIKFIIEIKRVIIHSLLHLIGYNDNNLINKNIMKKKENFYIKKLKNIIIK